MADGGDVAVGRRRRRNCELLFAATTINDIDRQVLLWAPASPASSPRTGTPAPRPPKFSCAAQTLTAAGGSGVIGALLFHAGRSHAAPGLLLQPSPERLP
jgi:hypothetical protein